jgi:hypothetical protein
VLDDIVDPSRRPHGSRVGVVFEIKLFTGSKQRL